MKVVINGSYGGFGLSYKACMKYAELSGFKLYPYLDHITRKVYGSRAVIGNESLLHHYSKVPISHLELRDDGDPIVSSDNYWSEHSLERTDPILIQVIEELGEAANGNHAELIIVEIPDDVQWHIAEYDGLEHVAENHRVWYD